MLLNAEQTAASTTRTVVALLALLPPSALDTRWATMHRAFYDLRTRYAELLPGLKRLEFHEKPGVTPVSVELDKIIQLLAGSTAASPLYHQVWQPAIPPATLEMVAEDLARLLDSSL